MEPKIFEKIKADEKAPKLKAGPSTALDGVEVVDGLKAVDGLEAVDGLMMVDWPSLLHSSPWQQTKLHSVPLGFNELQGIFCALQNWLVEQFLNSIFCCPMVYLIVKHLSNVGGQVNFGIMSAAQLVPSGISGALLQL